jgi:hypothetical protein
MTTAAASTAHSFHKIFNQARTHAKFRTEVDVNDSIKKIRRLILVEGIPTSIVRSSACYDTTVLLRSLTRLDVGPVAAAKDLESAAGRDGAADECVLRVCLARPV